MEFVYTHRLSELNKRRSVVEVNEKVASQSSKGTKYVKVRRGDTLGGIASKNRTTVAKIKRLNGLKGTNIRGGQRLRVR